MSVVELTFKLYGLKASKIPFISKQYNNTGLPENLLHLLIPFILEWIFCPNLLCLHDTELPNFETCAHVVNVDIKILRNKFQHWLQIAQAMILHTLKVVYMLKGHWTTSASSPNFFSKNLDFYTIRCVYLYVVTAYCHCHDCWIWHIHHFIQVWRKFLKLVCAVL